jgi:Holliday junction resolvase RusA-like endonuclease
MVDGKKDMDTMRIIIPGSPIAKARPRFVRRNKIKVGAYSSQETAEGLFLLDARKQVNRCLEGPLRVTCKFFMPRPKSHYGTGGNAGKLKASAPVYPLGKRNDIDNLVKFVFDCLNGLAWKDDSQVITSASSKVYHDSPQTEIFIEEI